MTLCATNFEPNEWAGQMPGIGPFFDGSVSTLGYNKGDWGQFRDGRTPQDSASTDTQIREDSSREWAGAMHSPQSFGNRRMSCGADHVWNSRDV
jgi:hypothetical protein